MLKTADNNLNPLFNGTVHAVTPETLVQFREMFNASTPENPLPYQRFMKNGAFQALFVMVNIRNSGDEGRQLVAEALAFLSEHPTQHIEHRGAVTEWGQLSLQQSVHDLFEMMQQLPRAAYAEIMGDVIKTMAANRSDRAALKFATALPAKYRDAIMAHPGVKDALAGTRTGFFAPRTAGSNEQPRNLTAE